VNYYDIVLLVEPKRVALRAANGQLNTANAKLKEVQDKVDVLKEKLAKLTKEFNEAESNRLEAQSYAEKGRLRLELANRLTRALGSEQIRWSSGIELLKAERNLLVGDCLTVAAVISYIGPFTKQYREMLVDKSFVPLIVTSPTGTSIPMTMDVEPIGTHSPNHLLTHSPNHLLTQG
jgi:dynein heavy chain